MPSGAVARQADLQRHLKERQRIEPEPLGNPACRRDVEGAVDLRERQQHLLAGGTEH